ncbi:hypothetical protein MB02_07905 [Croceicoccus estronivorus]|uniref:response regulator transcription factor n=1 Tax=Croceicoccus estronivorus TaxID=1172626 RepID=UPI000829D9EC|nr:response regulator [Croceicoccus estronivorus]OCC24180.1 hypothetical protein MB02_07905 [Croceicoccus estronivorus]
MNHRRNVYIVDDDSGSRMSAAVFLKSLGFEPSPFASGHDFLKNIHERQPGCVLLELCMAGLDGLDVLDRMGDTRLELPVVMMSDNGDIASALRAIKKGALDFLEKPLTREALIEALREVFDRLENRLASRGERERALALMESLTRRERQVLQKLGDGLSNKAIAFELGISTRTVEMHRANLMRRLKVRSLPEAMAIVFQATKQPEALPDTHAIHNHTN